MTDELMSTYNPLPVSLERGKGAWVWDTKGKRYLDAMGGIAVCALGHAHESITQVIQDQAGKLLHTSNLYHIDYQEALAKKLIALSGMEQAFFCNCGAEANEAALKLCRLYGHKLGINNPCIIVMEKAFHGRTLAMVSASGSRKIQAGFEPLVQGFIRAPYNDIAALETIAKHAHDVVAVMLEPIQGEGGIQIPAPDYLKKIRALCDEHQWLMVLDEVQTGMGRTGQFFCYQHENILPDIVTLAKALGNGIPIGVCLARGNARNLFHPGSHGSTFGGNPLSCRVALTVLETLEKEQLISTNAATGQMLLTQLKSKLAHHPLVADIRGKGLMIGIELKKPCRPILQIGLDKGILLNVTADNVIRLLPPYILDPVQIDYLIECVVDCINEFSDQNG